MENYNYTENELESRFLKEFQDLNYEYIEKQEIMKMRGHDFANVILKDIFIESLKKINKKNYRKSNSQNHR